MKSGEIAFGRGHLPVRPPTVVRKRPLPKLADQDAAIANALANPIGSSPLGELARARSGGGILICDITRPNLGKELAELVDDPWVLANVSVENHFARDEWAHVDLGFVPRYAG